MHRVVSAPLMQRILFYIGGIALQGTSTYRIGRVADDFKSHLFAMTRAS